MSIEILVRPETPGDFAAVRALHTAAFGQPDEAQIVDLVRDSTTPTLSLVAEVDGEVAGHVLFSPVEVQSGSPSLQACGMGPVGVAPLHQRRGIGTQLIEDGLRQCPGLGWNATFVLGDPRYYSRFGFALAAPLGLHFVGPQFDTAFQCRELRSGALEGSSGLVQYHAAFGDA